MSDSLDKRVAAVSAVMNIAQLAADVALYVCDELDIDRAINNEAKLATPSEVASAMYSTIADEDSDPKRQQLTNLALVVISRDINTRPLIQ